MGSFVENNDTLQLTKAQGFPSQLNLELHLATPFRAENFAGEIFTFKDKPRIRNYQQPPVRNFLAENRDGKWIYWGRIEVLTVLQDLEYGATSGTFRLQYLFTPEEMKVAHRMIDGSRETDYFHSD